MEWDVSLYDEKHSFVPRYGRELIEVLDPKPGETILDVGCGSGHLTAVIAERGAVPIGIDLSESMIRAASSQYPHLDFRLRDASDFDLSETVDAIFSNAALHWIHRAEDAVRCMSKALRLGGRLVVEFGGKGNVEGIRQALEDAIEKVDGRRVDSSNYFPSISQYSTLLEKHGMEVREASLFDRWTRLEDGENGIVQWVRMFRPKFLEKYSPAIQQDILEEMKARLRDRFFQDGAWYADYRRLRIVATKIES